MATSKRAGKHSLQQNDNLFPAAPLIGTATDVGTNRAYNNGAASVTFTAQGPNAATSYTVTSSPGGYTGTGSSSPVTVTGLQSNTSYTFTVKASNSYGDSDSSSASNSITATTVPAAPAAPTATSPTGSSDGVNQAGTTTDSLSWTEPANGGKAITGYYWQSNDNKGGFVGNVTSITGIAQEGSTSQAYRIYAINANGNSEYSLYSNTVTTFAFTPFSVFGFSPFSVFGFSPFGVFGFSPSY